VQDAAVKEKHLRRKMPCTEKMAAFAALAGCCISVRFKFGDIRLYFVAATQPNFSVQKHPTDYFA